MRDFKDIKVVVAGTGFWKLFLHHGARIDE